MARTEAIVRGREAFARRHWRQAYDLLSAADGETPLGAADLERLATAAYLVGEDAPAVAAWTRAHHALIDDGAVARAARLGFRLSLHMLLAGEMARSTGWLSRSQRLLKDRADAGAAPGYGLIVTGLLAMGQGDAATAGAGFEEAIALAERFDDPDLLALGLLSRGESLIAQQRNGEGVARLDEAALTVTAGDVSPVLAGIVYCAVILACQRIFDLRRAGEWTRALDEWCASQPDLMPYRGRCLVHRSEILQLQGDWPAALAEAAKARAHLAGRSEGVVGHACYQAGELHRLRGEFGRAAAMYRAAGRNGYEPQPGLALLQLAEGRPDAAAAAIRAAAGFPGDGEDADADPARARLLGPCVEIAIAAGDLDTARAAAEALTRISTALDAPFLLATATGANGAVLLAEGRMKAALALLRESWALWQQLETPYEAARVQVRLGAVCRALGDEESARMHRDAARAAFERLGAAPDLAALERRAGGESGALTDRERQVLARVAAGETNRQIAAALGISAHTVARHLSNIFDKLGVSSRTAAGAFAHKHGLV